MIEFTARQKELLNNIESELRKQTALEYIKLGYENKTQAYINACAALGKEPSKNPTTSGVEILGYPSVSAFINEMRVEVAKKVQIDAAWVLQQAVKVHERCMQAEPVMVRTENGMEPSGEYKFDSSGANKALDIIGKHVDVQAFLTKQETKHVLSDDFDLLLGSAVDDKE